MLGTAVRYFAQKAKPVELKTPPEPTKTITRAIFDIVKEHGPITLSDTWERLKVASPRGLTCKRHMKVVLGWMKKRQKLRLICKQAGRQKYYYYTTWFTKSNIPEKPINDSVSFYRIYK